jgi:ATP-dependent Clp protease adaptor protein ClpS
MEFVTWVLETIFDKTENEAYDLMITVHNVGKAIVATETKEIAEQKVYETKQVADLNNYSWFTVTIEQVSDD